MLSLPVEFLHESLIWNADHHLEFVNDDVKRGKMAKRTDMATLLQFWIQELDTNLQFIMTKLRTGEQHTQTSEMFRTAWERYLKIFVSCPREQMR